VAYPGKAKYSFAHKTHAIALAQALGVSRAAEVMQIPYATLKGWADRGRVDKEALQADIAAAEEQYRQAAAQLALWGAVRAFAEAASPEKLAKASALEAAKVAGILTDKWLLLTGRATNIVDSRNLQVQIGTEDLFRLRGMSKAGGDSVATNARLLPVVRAMYRQAMQEAGARDTTDGTNEVKPLWGPNGTKTKEKEEKQRRQAQEERKG